jgi:hypothetical protein
MYYQLRILVCWMIGAAYAFGIFPSSALGQSLLSTFPVANKTGGDPFAIGKTLLKTNTLDYIKQPDLIAKVAGKPSMNAFNKYGGDFDKYYIAVESQRAGKVFEAMDVFKKNRELARSGSSRRFLVTAAEGYPGHAADVLEIDGLVKRQFQYKSNWNNGQSALFEPKYSGMKIVIPKDKMEILKQNLNKAESKALRRNVALNPKWQTTKEAILDRRIIASSLSTKDIEAASKRTLQAEWNKRGFEIEPRSTPNVGKSSSATAGSKVVGKTVAGGLIVLGIAAEGYQTYTQWERYRSGEIGGDHFTTKLTMQGAQIGLAGALFAAPEPIVTKIGGLVVIVLVFAGGDQIVETSIEKRQEHAKHILETIDRDERFHSARQQLLQ